MHRRDEPPLVTVDATHDDKVRALRALLQHYLRDMPDRCVALGIGVTLPLLAEVAAQQDQTPLPAKP